jgi:predicted DNA-binding helix-hairpin-helix protein
MDLYARLHDLSSQMDFEPETEGDCPSPSMRLRAANAINVSHAAQSNGKQISLLKTLLTSACERDCYYCPFRAGRDFRRNTLKPDEMAKTFMALQRAGLVEGLFLSSGIAGSGMRIQDKLIATAEILRQRYSFSGYIHLKIMPGAEVDQIRRAMQLADRVSINLEAPNKLRLQNLAPHKNFFEELVSPMQWVNRIRTQESPEKAYKNRWPSMTTQFVIGAVGDTDLEILQTTDSLHRKYRLNRAYFSAFNPVPDTPFENTPAAEPVRQQRLYQASFLIRDYGFLFEELPFEKHGNLPVQEDPKMILAKQNLLENPLEINLADRHELLRIPGIGQKGAQAILSARRLGKIKSPSDLKKLGIVAERVMPFVLLEGRRPPKQLSFLVSG